MSLSDARKVLHSFAAYGDGMPMSYAQAFLEVAEDPGLSITTLAERIGMPLSTVSRIVAALSDTKKYNLITVAIAHDEKRRKMLGLTSVGQQLAASL